MKPEQIFIGSIKRCTKYDMKVLFSSSLSIGEEDIFTDCFGYIEQESEPYKQNAVLIKIENGGYVDLDRFNSILDYIRIYGDITKEGYRSGGLMMSTAPHKVGNLFVDESTLKPYYASKPQATNISIRQLKKELKALKKAQTNE